MNADAKLSYPEQLESGPLAGALKLVVVNGVCVGYAGTYTHAVDSLRDISNSGNTNYDEILEALFETHNISNGEVDFLVATYNPSVKLSKIYGGEIEYDIEAAWIGDQKAFEEYQKIYYSLPSPPRSEGHTEEESAHYEVISKMSDALGEIVREQKFEFVGEFTISVRTSSTGFRYLGNAMAAIVPQEIPSGVSTALKFGTAAQGGYAYTVLTPILPNIGVIGVHFHQGNVGALYHPLENDEAIVYSGVTFDEFKGLVLRDFDFEIDGIKIT
ncbi:MAG: hypothetical protein KZQ73_01155 [Candidatus Thiodiazotropha sp. (ex Semelilucina semeliformis)]|nr:hypothetical protein [Candidatus Thiodiazotropha sp. (ex Semelilucina semeliformis)]